MFNLSAQDIDRLIAEDVPYGDLTTHVLGIGAQPGRVVFAARGEMVVCGVEEARAIFERLGATVEAASRSGQELSAGATLLAVDGSAQALFMGWKIAQTLIEWASGIATAVSTLVNTARTVAPRAVIACTRKTVPFSRCLSVKAVLAGGGAMHRVGLSETVLLFPEHRIFDDRKLLDSVARLRAQAPERSIVVEVTTINDALVAAQVADVVQLEKFSLEDIGRTVAHIREMNRRTLIAAAGGINVANVARYAEMGIDIVVTSSPYYAPPRDVQVTFTRT